MEAQAVTLQPYKAVWDSLKVVHTPSYQGVDGYTLEPTAMEIKERIAYERIKFAVELFQSGELLYCFNRQRTSCCFMNEECGKEWDGIKAI